MSCSLLFDSYILFFITSVSFHISSTSCFLLPIDVCTHVAICHLPFYHCATAQYVYVCMNVCMCMCFGLLESRSAASEALAQLATLSIHTNQEMTFALR